MSTAITLVGNLKSWASARLCETQPMNAAITWMQPADQWGNRVALGTTNVDVSKPNARDPLGLAVFESMLTTHLERFGDGCPQPVPARTDIKPQHASSDFGFAGWDPAPIRGAQVATPISFSILEFPFDGAPCPWPGFSPWWESILPSRTQSPTSSFLAGKAMYSGRRSSDGWDSSSARDQEYGLMEIRDDSLILWVRYRLDSERVSKSGLPLFLVSPMAADVKDFVSDVTKRTETFELGCRIPFSSVSGIGYRLAYSMVRALFGKARKAFDSAGHGSLKLAEVFVEVNDGWGPLHATLSLRPGVGQSDLDLAILDWVSSLRMKVAAERLSSGELVQTAEEPTQLYAAPMPPTSSVTQEKDAFDKVAVKTEVWRIPGATIFGAAPRSSVEPLVS